MLTNLWLITVFGTTELLFWKQAYSGKELVGRHCNILIKKHINKSFTSGHDITVIVDEIKTIKNNLYIFQEGCKSKVLFN